MVQGTIRWLPLLVAAALLLSGCAASAPKPVVQDVTEKDFEDLGLQTTKTTGIIRGVVYDEAIRPLAGVSISMTGGDGALRNTTTTTSGLFGFDALEGGTYFLQITKEGYIPVQQAVEVIAGQKDPKITKVSLPVDPINQPRVEVFQYEAFLACSFTFPVVSFAACGLTGVSTLTDNRFLVEYKPDAPPAWIQTEAVWKSTNPFGASLSLSITDFRGNQVGVNDTSGISPRYITVNQTRAAQAAYGEGNPITIRLFSTSADGTDVFDESIVHNAWAQNLYGPYNSTPAAATARQYLGSGAPSAQCIKYPTLFDACLRWGGVGIVLNQQVRVYTHIFHGYTPPSDWRFSSQGPPPEPRI